MEIPDSCLFQPFLLFFPMNASFSSDHVYRQLTRAHSQWLNEDIFWNWTHYRHVETQATNKSYNSDEASGEGNMNTIFHHKDCSRHSVHWESAYKSTRIWGLCWFGYELVSWWYEIVQNFLKIMWYLLISHRLPWYVSRNWLFIVKWVCAHQEFAGTRY